MKATQQCGTPYVLNANEQAKWNAWYQHKRHCERCKKFTNDLLCATGLMLWDEWMLASSATKGATQ